MADAATYAKLTPLLRDVFDDDGLVAVPDLTAHEVRGWDSLGNIRLFLQIEREFSLRFSTDEITSLRNVGALADLIEKKTLTGKTT
jgi:acyl carrier protein